MLSCIQTTTTWLKRIFVFVLNLIFIIIIIIIHVYTCVVYMDADPVITTV